MIWLLIPLLLLLLVSGYILLAPFYLELDSSRGIFRFRFHRLASARLYIKESSLLVDLKIFLWIKTIDLLAPRKEKKKKVIKKKKKKKRRMIPFRKIWAVVKSFKVNTCTLNIDTGNMPLNGILYPAFLWVSVKTGKHLMINFRDENEIIFETKNNIAHMLWAFINS
jgi:hypothetical protein